jgi:hypothetical protein
MGNNREIKRNRGFRRAFIAGSLMIILSSLIISWITVSIIRGLEKKIPNKGVEESQTDQEGEDKSLKEGKDTVYIEKIKEIKKIDTIYKYIQVQPISKPKLEESHKDTTSK